MCPDQACEIILLQKFLQHIHAEEFAHASAVGRKTCRHLALSHSLPGNCDTYRSVSAVQHQLQASANVKQAATFCEMHDCIMSFLLALPGVGIMNDTPIVRPQAAMRCKRFAKTTGQWHQASLEAGWKVATVCSCNMQVTHK